MKRWSRLTALMLAFVIMFSNVSGALAAVEVDYDALMQWIQEVKEANGLGDVIKLIRGGEKLVFPEYEFEQPNEQMYPDGENTVTLDYAAGEADEKAVELYRYGKVTLSAPAAGQWQVYLDSADTWVNVAGETGSTFELTYAKVESLFEQNGYAMLRSVVGDTVTQTAAVGLTYAVAAMPATAEDDGMAYSARSQNNSGIMLAAEDEEPDTSVVYVKVWFMRGNEEVYSAYTAQLPKGGGLKTTVPVHTLLGYITTDEFEQDSDFEGTAKLTGATQTTAGKMELDLKNVQADLNLYVYYQADYVQYQVKHILQTLDGEYPEEDVPEKLIDTYTNTQTNQTVTEVNGELAKTAEELPGFDPLWYDKDTKVAANGETVVRIRYEREYHLIKFELGEDAYGTEPIYARYGATLPAVTNPTRPGYTFEGWELNGENATLPKTMPAQDQTYTAIWIPNDQAKVTVVFWGQNANDDEYSYYKSGTLFATPGSEFNYSDDIANFLICGQDEHTHGEGCQPTLDCDIQVHEHTSECCTKDTDHVHTTDCYDRVGSANEVRDWDLEGAPPDPVDGQIYKRNGNNYRRLIYISGTWYRYTDRNNGYNPGSGTVVNPNNSCKGAHSHDDGTCTCTQREHTHDEDCYTYSCGSAEHTHNSSCYQNGSGMDAALWKLNTEKTETVTVNADGTTVVNVYYIREEFTLTFYDSSRTVYTIKERWGADITEHWPIKGTNGTTYDDGQRWDPSGSKIYTAVLVYIPVMPAETFTLSVDNGGANDYTMHYMTEVLPGETGELYNGKNFEEAFSVNAKYGYITKAEDFFDLEGFTQWDSDPSFGSSNRIEPNDGQAYFYYTRNRYDLVFYNGNDIDKVFSENADHKYASVNGDGVLYEQNLSSYNYTPELPTDLYEEGSRTFEGWYLNPECTKKADLTTMTMPLDGLILYANWVPNYHTVRFYLEKEDVAEDKQLATHPAQTVLHGTSIDVADPVNGAYSFVEWFYMDGDTEKAYDFENMPINKDLQVYAKWTADDPMEFTVYYKLKDAEGNKTETLVAETTTGMALDDETITLPAKTGDELFEDYQVGCFPEVVSASLNIDIEDADSRTYTFWYRKVETMEYTVNHIKVTTVNGEEQEEVFKTDTKNTTNAIVTEKYEKLPGYAPDKYQKSLVISLTESNVINFYYRRDLVNAIYSVVHKTQPLNVAVGDYEKYVLLYPEFNESLQIGTLVDAEREQLEGFTFEYAVITKTSINANDEATADRVEITDLTTPIEAELTSGGVTFELYYKRNEYPYTVRYLLNEPDAQGNYPTVQDPKTGNGLYGENITETAPEIPGYYVGNNTNRIIIGVEDPETTEPENLLEFYYNENIAWINYKVVGPTADCGTVELNDQDPDTLGAAEVSESVKVLSGDALGAIAVPSSSAYKFVGWYTDAACTNKVTAVDGTLSGSSENVFDPVKEAAYTDEDGNDIPAMYEGTTFYAKFEYNLTYLTIEKSGAAADDTFVFEVTDGDLDDPIQVVIQGNSSVTIYGLTVDEKYTVTEIAHNFRYGDPAAIETDPLVADPDNTRKNKIAFVNTITNNQWLDDDDYEPNAFTGVANQ